MCAVLAYIIYAMGGTQQQGYTATERNRECGEKKKNGQRRTACQYQGNVPGLFVTCIVKFITQEGRGNRDQHGFKKRRKALFTSTTNREKDKNKNFMMMRQNRRVRSKGKRSFREKQVTHKANTHTHTHTSGILVSFISAVVFEEVFDEET